MTIYFFFKYFHSISCVTLTFYNINDNLVKLKFSNVSLLIIVNFHLKWKSSVKPSINVKYSFNGRFFLNIDLFLKTAEQQRRYLGIPKKKLKSNNGLACTQQPKNTVAMLNELRQGLVYNLEGQTGPVHAPIFTMTVEVCEFFKYSTTKIVFKRLNG